MALAEAGRSCDGLADVVARARHGGAETHLLGEAGSDGRGKGAAGAVRVAAFDPRILEALHPAVMEKQVDHALALEMTALHQHRPRAGEKLVALGAKAVLMKGGHLEGDRVIDLLVHDGKVDRFEDARIASRHTHGTGCTLASATAAGLAQKMSLSDAFARARAYVRKAIETAPGYGGGHGPLNHAVTVRPG